MKSRILLIAAFLALVTFAIFLFPYINGEQRNSETGAGSDVNDGPSPVAKSLQPIDEDKKQTKQPHTVSQTATQPDVTGRWLSLLGTIEIDASSGRVIGSLKSPNSGITMEQGTTVLEGVMIEDCLSGKIRLDAPGCPSEIWGFGVLLLAEDGHVLSGSIHFDSNGCRVQGLTGDKSLYWVRSASPEPGADKPFKSMDRQQKRITTSRTNASPTPSKNAYDEQDASHQATPDDVLNRREDREQGLAGPVPRPGTYDPRKALPNKKKALMLKRQGQSMLQAGRFEKAREKFEAALQESPCDPFAINGIGITYSSRNQVDEALTYFKKALTCDPNYMDIYYNIGCMYALKDKPDLAIQYLKIALMNGFTELAIMRKDQDLQSLHGNQEFQALLRGEF